MHIRRTSIAPTRGGSIDPFQTELGAVLRRTRVGAGLSLRDVETATAGRFKASAIGSYERGEREISARRLVELATALHVRPEDILTETLRRLSPDGYRPVAVDLSRLARLHGPSAVVLGGYAQRVKRERGDLHGEVVTIRSGDLAILAAEAAREPSEMLEDIRPAIVTKPRPRR